jgi:hypothetical protein
VNSRQHCKDHSPLHRGICSETPASDSFLEEEEGRGSVDDNADGKMSTKQRQVDGDIWYAGQVEEKIQNFDAARPTMTSEQIKSLQYKYS